MPKYIFLFLIAVSIVMPVSVYAEGQKETQIKEVSQIEEISLSVSQLTGIAISPLFVTAAIGIYKNIRAPSAEARNNFPWYFQSWFITICVVLSVTAFIISIPSITLNIPPQVSGFVELVNKKIGLILTTPVMLCHVVTFVLMYRSINTLF